MKTLRVKLVVECECEVTVPDEVVIDHSLGLSGLTHVPVVIEEHRTHEEHEVGEVVAYQTVKVEVIN